MLSNIEIGNRIKQRRKELGLTMQELAEIVGLNKSTILRYETGKIEKVKIPVIKSLSEVLGIDLLSEKIENKRVIADSRRIEIVRRSLNTIVPAMNDDELYVLESLLLVITRRIIKRNEGK